MQTTVRRNFATPARLALIFVLVIGLFGAHNPNGAIAAGEYIDPATALRIANIDSSVTSVSVLSDNSLALLSGAYNNAHPSVRVIRADGSTVYITDLSAALGTRAANKDRMYLYPIANGEAIVTVEGTTDGCDNNTGNLFRFLRLNAVGQVTTALTDISMVTRAFNCYTQMALLSNGNLAFIYKTAGDEYQLRILQPNGTPVTGEISVQKTGTGNGTCGTGQPAFGASIAANPNGSFLITHDCNANTNLYGTRYNNDGTQLTTGATQHFVIGPHEGSGDASEVNMILTDGNYLVAYRDAYASGTFHYAFKQITPAGVVSDAGGISSSKPDMRFSALGDGGFVSFSQRTSITTDRTYYDVAAVFTNTGTLAQIETDLDTTYVESCTLDMNSCASDANPMYSLMRPRSGTGYRMGVWYLNSRTHDLLLHHFFAPPTAVTGAATAVTSASAALAGTVNANNASTTVTFAYGTTTAYGSRAAAAQSPVTGTTNTPVNAAISGLTPNTTYHFRVEAVNTGGTTYGTDATFTTNAVAPAATTNAASAVTTSGATLNGTVNANNQDATVTFDYGLTNAYGSSISPTPSTVTGAASTPVSAVLSGLVPNTPYHFRVVAQNATGTTYGDDATFTTDAMAPSATPIPATHVTDAAATLNGTVNAFNASTTVTFQYGTTTAYGGSADAAQSPVTGVMDTLVSLAISGLTPNTTYHFRIEAVNTGGTTYSADATFTTASITTGAASLVTSATATLHGAIQPNDAGTIQALAFEYGLTSVYGSTAAALPASVTGSSVTDVSAALSGLIPNTLYHFRVIGQDRTGSTYAGADMTFTTAAAAPSASTHAATRLWTTGAMLNGTVKANNSSTTITFAYGLTSAYGSSVSADPAIADGLADTPVSAAINGLTAHTTYHFRVVAVNSAGTTYGEDMTFTTPLYQYSFPIALYNR